MHSSLQTLDRIIERDCVDDLFRRGLVWKEIAFNLLGCLAGAGGAAYSVSSMAEAGIDFGHGLLGGISLAIAGFSVKGLHKALKTRQNYLDGLGQGVQPDHRPYFIDGLVSGSGTAVERAYGFPVRAVDSLDYIGREDGAPSLLFLDHVCVRDVRQGSFETTEVISTSEGTFDQQVTYHHGSFVLERFGNRRFLSFSFRSVIPDEVKHILSFAGDNLALIFTPAASGSLDCEAPLNIYKIYHPHP